MKLNGDIPIIITVIYPDGNIETISKDDRNFHMEYMKSLIDSSERLRKIIDDKKIYLPNDIDEIRYMLSYELCTKLIEEGLIVINNLCIDKSYLDDEIFDEFYNIYLPKELTDEQVIVFKDLLNENNMVDSVYGILQDNEMVDITYNEAMDIINNKSNSMKK